MYEFFKKYRVNIGTIVAVVGIVFGGVTLIMQSNQNLRDDLADGDQRLGDRLIYNSTELREEIRLINQELRDEIRNSNHELLQSLGNHSHDDEGNPQFSIPPGTNPTDGKIPRDNEMEREASAP